MFDNANKQTKDSKKRNIYINRQYWTALTAPDLLGYIHNKIIVGFLFLFIFLVLSISNTKTYFGFLYLF